MCSKHFDRERSQDCTDIDLAATAIPRITDDFHSLDDVGWYGSAYLLTQSCFQLHFGKLYKHFSSKWVLLSSITIFEIGSLVCATSPDSLTLIVGQLQISSSSLFVLFFFFFLKRSRHNE